MIDDNLLPPPPEDEEPATPESTRNELLGSQQRARTAIRSAFVQQRGGERAPGPLHKFVRERRLFALQLYLLLHCVASGKPWDYAMPAASWARALDRANPSAEATVSRSWSWLKDHQLVSTMREGRTLRVWLLEEDGSGEKYTRSKDFFYLPLAFFEEAWHTKLELPGTVVLLIALERSRYKPWFELRTEPASEWFGISADTLQRGIDELQDNSLLRVEPRKVRVPKARTGFAIVNSYALLGSFRTPQPMKGEQP